MDGSDYLKAFLFHFFFFFCRSLRKNKQCVNDCCGDSEKGVCVTRSLALAFETKAPGVQCFRCTVYLLFSYSAPLQHQLLHSCPNLYPLKAT